MNGKYFSSVGTTSMLIHITSEDISSEAVILVILWNFAKDSTSF